MATGLNATLVTFVSQTTISSTDMNANLSALNNASTPTFTQVTVGNGTDAFLSIDEVGTKLGTGVTPPSSPSLSLLTGSSLGIGAYKYVVTYVSLNGESTASSFTSITTTSGNQAVQVTIPIGQTGITARNIYRTKVGAGTFFLVATVADNVTTTYNDTTADASLPATQPPTHPTIGGALWKSSGGALQAAIYGDGAISFDAGSLTSNGSGSLTGSGLASFSTLSISSSATLSSTISIGGLTTFTKSLSAGNQLMDFEQGYGLWSDNTAGTFTGGTTRLWIDSPNNGEVHIGGRASGNVLAGCRIRANELMITDGTSFLNLFPGATSSFPGTVSAGSFSTANDVTSSGTVSGGYIQGNNGVFLSGSNFFGVKTTGGTKLFEIDNTGNAIIPRAYFTNSSFNTISTSDPFGNPNFDYAECFLMAREFTNGTVVCQQKGVLDICPHAKCARAFFASSTPGFCAGVRDKDAGFFPAALSGRITARTMSSVREGQFVCSDGYGGVRPMRKGEEGAALGFALLDSHYDCVSICIRPMWYREG